MFRLIIFTCFLHFSVDGKIYGNIILDNDPARTRHLPIGCTLSVQLQDAALAGSISSVLKHADFKPIVSIPIPYEIDIPTSISPAGSYLLAAEISKNDDVLFSTQEPVPIQIDPHSSLQINIPVIDLYEDEETNRWLKHRRDTSWPEMVGKPGTYAVQYIKEKTGFTNVFTAPDGKAFDTNIRFDRVRVTVAPDGTVIYVPRAG